MNFEYSPGLFGYGVKGADGSAGIYGMGIHYTDFDFIRDIDIITNRIQRNETLFSIDPSGKTLPGGRTYLDYEFIVDDRGNICIITNVATGEYSDPPFLRFAMANYFEDSSTSTASGYPRYSNMYSDPSLPYYIIDNVYNVKRGSYLTYPNKIYGIRPKNFARVEFSNSNRDNYNPFSVYSSGQFRYIDDKKSIGIVRNINENQFRIGNIQNEVINDTNIIFDASLIQKNSFPIRVNSNEGEILSNYEANCQSLYTNIFSESPATLEAITEIDSTLTITWNLNDITPDASINADLNIYKIEENLPSIQYIIHNINAEGSINFSGVIENEIYEYFISVIKNGWKRNTYRKQYTIGSAPATMDIIDPANNTLSATTNGLIGGLSSYEVDLSTNSRTGWSLSNIPSWITCNPTSALTYSNNEHFTLTVAPNPGGPRSASIRVNSQAPSELLYVSQEGYTAITLTIAPGLADIRSNTDFCSPFTGTVSITANTVEPYTWKIARIEFYNEDPDRPWQATGYPQGSFFRFTPGVNQPQTGNGSIDIFDIRAYTSSSHRRLAIIDIVYSLNGPPQTRTFKIRQLKLNEACLPLLEE